MKTIIKLSLENRSLNHLFFLFLIIFAYFSYSKIAKEMFPPNSLDRVIVQGTYIGASPTILDKLIVKDIEKILLDNQNLEDIHTLISSGTFHINAQIKDSYKKQKIVNNIKNKIENLKKDLPSDMDLPTVDTVESYFSLLYISISSKTNTNYIEVAKQLRDEIKKLRDLYSVELNENYENILQITLNQEKIKAYNVSVSKTIQALKSLYSLYPIGKVNTKDQKYYLNTQNSNISIKKILNSFIKVDNSLIFIKDIAKIKYAYEESSLINKTNAKPSVSINIKKDKSGDSIELSKQIRKTIAHYQSTYKDIEFKVLSDSSFWIKTRLNVISSNIIIGLILLFFAIWIFISLKIALVVILGIPVSFAFGLIGLDFFDASLNTLSMIGVLLSLGILVDEAIVVSENIHRHQSNGKDIKTACIDGTSEVMPILFASMLTSIIAFAPLTMLSGGLGMFIKIIPLMVIILIISSFIESFLFLPLHYKDLSFKIFENNKNDFRERFWNKITNKYKQSLAFFIKRKYINAFLLIFFILFFTVIFAKNAKFQLFPEFDAMSINITGKVKNNSLTYTNQKIAKLEKLLLEKLKKENIASISTIIGMNSDGRSKHDRGDNLFTFTLHLKQKIPDDFFNKYINPIFIPLKDDYKNRTRTIFAQDIKAKIYTLVKQNNIEDDFIEFNINIPQTGVVKNDIVISVSHKNNNKIQEVINSIKKNMQDMEYINNINDDMNFDEIKIDIDLNTYGRSLGFTQTSLVKKVRNLISNKDLSKVINTKLNLIQLQVDFLNKKDIKTIKNLSLEVPNSSKVIFLKDIANLYFTKDVTNIKKDNLRKVFTITANIEKKHLSSREFFEKINPLLENIKKDGVKLLIKGEEKTNKQIQKDILLSFLVALGGILLVLTWLFSSLFLSLFALSVIPLSIFGVLIGHSIMNINITFSSLLGFIGLIGIVINDTLII